MKTNVAHQPVSAGPISFRQHLQVEVARRCSRNARYSLRAFARDLGVDHSTLSQILRGCRTLSPRTIERLGRRLGFDAATIELYVAIETHAARAAAGPSSEAEQLTRDAVAILSEGHHHALLELCRLEDFRPDSRWVARVLGLEVDQVNIAVSRLARLGLLRLEQDRWIDCSGDEDVSARAFPEVTLRRLFERLRRSGGLPARVEPFKRPARQQEE